MFSPIKQSNIFRQDHPDDAHPAWKARHTRPLDGMSPRITWTLYASNGSVASYEHFQKYDQRKKSP